MLLAATRGMRRVALATERKSSSLPALLLVELVAHVLGELAELALRFGIVSVDHKVLQMPEAPAQVLEALPLLEEAGDLGADLIAKVEYKMY